MTLQTVLEEIESRIKCGVLPLDAFVTVAEGVRNWKEKDDAVSTTVDTR